MHIRRTIIAAALALLASLWPSAQAFSNSQFGLPLADPESVGMSSEKLAAIKTRLQPVVDQGIRVMGIDAWGWDIPLHMQAEAARAAQEPGVFWAAHQADVPYLQIERLVNLGGLPSSGFKVACFPLKIKGASAGPARVVAILED